jgi:hypothetical protein
MQAIRTRYYGPTNSRGSRIQAKCEARAIYLPYDHALNLDGNHRAACEALMIAMGWTPEHGRAYVPRVGGVFGHDYYWVTLNDTQTDAAA